MRIYVLAEYGGCGCEPIAYADIEDAFKVQGKAWLDHQRLLVVTPVEVKK